MRFAVLIIAYNLVYFPLPDSLLFIKQSMEGFGKRQLKHIHYTTVGTGDTTLIKGICG